MDRETCVNKSCLDDNSSFAESLVFSRLLQLPEILFQHTHTKELTPSKFININLQLLSHLGINKENFTSNNNLLFLSGNSDLSLPSPISTVYAGHQFGIYTSILGDGRVHTLGEYVSHDKGHWEIQLKGAGATPFARGNTGRMNLAEGITEYLGSEAIAGIGINCSRGLALINQQNSTTNRPGSQCILARIAPSHLRFGHFEYCYNQNDIEALRRLCDHTIEHHYPELHYKSSQDDIYLQFLYAVIKRSANLVAQWQAVGFVHSVMNTDNMSILGLTLDLGVYGFMETYNPGFSPNENDDQDRYAYDQQTDVARWNCLALAETLKPLLPGQKIPSTILRIYRREYTTSYYANMRKKLGLTQNHDKDEELINSLLSILKTFKQDYTGFFRNFTMTSAKPEYLHYRNETQWNHAISQWLSDYHLRLLLESTNATNRESMMLNNNPKYILRKKQLDKAIENASRSNDYVLFEQILAVLQSPYEEHPEYEHLALSN